MAEAGYGRARDEAFRAAVESAKQHFHRCPRCSNYFCDRCWNIDKGLCLSCAPDTEAEIEAARAEGEVSAAREAATGSACPEHGGKPQTLETAHA